MLRGDRNALNSVRGFTVLTNPFNFLSAAEFDVAITKYFTTPTADDVRFEVQAELLSSVR